MTLPGNEAPFVVDELAPFSWDSTESVSYEAALEAVSEVLGCYTALIASERAKANPDEQLITQWREGRRHCGEQQRTLNPSDHEEVARVRREYAELGRRLGDAQ